MKQIGKLKTKSSAEIKNTRIGLGFEGYDRWHYKPERCYDLAAQTGSKIARLNSGWMRTEREVGVYDFAWLDEVVDNLLARGMVPWFTVGYGNPIYIQDILNEDAVGCVPLYYGDDVLTAWINYLKALAEHYKGRVTHYEIWNEADISVFWYPMKPSAQEYARLIKISGAAIRSVDPAAKIGGATSMSRIPFIYGLFSSLDPCDIDFYCPHNYDRFPERSVRAKRIRMIREITDALGFDKMELWMGECGHASWHPVGHGQCKEGGGNEHRQAVWHLRRAFYDLADGLTYTSYFSVADYRERPYSTARTTQKLPAAQGVLDGITYTPKKAHETLGYLAIAQSDDCKPCTPIGIVEDYDGDEEIATASFSRNGKPVMAYWLGTPIEQEEQSGTCSIVLSPLVEIKNPVLIDMYTGAVFEATEDLKMLPIREYPILITDKDTYGIIETPEEN